MTEKRFFQIAEEAERRAILWLTNETFDKMSCGGSMIRFGISIGLLGYPFQKPDWMKGEKFNKFITDDEFDSEQYDLIISLLFENCMKAQKEFDNLPKK